jgi:hypothetical protein
MSTETPLQALDVVRLLVAGRDPANGAELDEADVCRQPLVAAALCSAAMALEDSRRRALRRATLPENVGKPWSALEDEELLRGYEQQESLAVLAVRLRRTRAAIRARLERYGRTPERGAP